MDERGRKELEKFLDKDSLCYVLITCGQPSEDGQMQVEMTYQGDIQLASYLVQGAKNILDQEQELENPSSKNIRLVK